MTAGELALWLAGTDVKVTGRVTAGTVVYAVIGGSMEERWDVAAALFTAPSSLPLVVSAVAS